MSKMERLKCEEGLSTMGRDTSQSNEAKIREEADALRPKYPKKEKKFTTEEVVDRMITDAVMLKEPFSRFMNIQRMFLKQIHKEIAEKKQRIYAYEDSPRNKDVVPLDWIDIIFRRYTE
jgi:hypothetical protein